MGYSEYVIRISYFRQVPEGVVLVAVGEIAGQGDKKTLDTLYSLPTG